MARAMLGTEIYERLVSTAEELIGSENGANVTLAEVEKTAGVGEGKMDMFFETEADLAAIVYDRCYRRTLRGCADAIADSSKDYAARIHAGIRYVQDAAATLERVRNLMDGVQSVKSRIVTYVDSCEALKTSLQGTFGEMKDKGVFAGDPEAKAAYIAYGLLGLHWLDCSELTKADLFRDYMLSMLPVVEQRKVG